MNPSIAQSMIPGVLLDLCRFDFLYRESVSMAIGSDEVSRTYRPKRRPDHEHPPERLGQLGKAMSVLHQDAPIGGYEANRAI